MNIEDPNVPLERNLYGHPLAGDYCGSDRLKFYWDLDGKSAKFGMSIRSSKAGIILTCICGRHQNGWNGAEYCTRVEESDDHVYLRCTQRDCASNESLIEQYKEMFDSRISAGGTE